MSVDVNLVVFVFPEPRLRDFVWELHREPVSSAPAAVHKRELPWHILTRAWVWKVDAQQCFKQHTGFQQKTGNILW